MKEPLSVRLFLGRAFVWALLPALAVGFFIAYRWGERQRMVSSARSVAPAHGVTLRMENAPFQGYTNGRLAWMLHADQIEAQRSPGSSLASVASATLTGIRDGALYEIPSDIRPVLSTHPGSSIPNEPSPESSSGRAQQLFSSKRPKTPPAAMFQAQQGFYTYDESEPLPPTLASLYTVQWRFKLAGNVDFRTNKGDHLRAESLTILELMHKRTWRIERRILCDAGVRISSKGVEAISNSAVYFPKERTVECTGGVRGTSKEVTVQAERFFWFLGEETIRCPEMVSGTVRGNPFTAEGLVIDMKRDTLHANRARIEHRNEQRASFGLP